VHNQTEFRIQAEFIVVDSQRILQNGQLVICNGRIIELCESADLRPDLVLPRSTLLPGFINAHTHLEFSDLDKPFPAGPDFPSWIAAVVRHRRKQLGALGTNELIAYRQQVIQAGLAECLETGTAALADIVTAPWTPPQTSVSKNADGSANGSLQFPKVIAMPELIGLDSERFLQSLSWAKGLLSNRSNSDSSYDSSLKTIAGRGVSPHSPYSLIHPLAIESLTEIDSDVTMAMHVAESLEERQWCQQGNGPFLEMYQRIGLPTNAPRMQIGEALNLLAGRKHSLLVHGNYLTELDLDRIAESSIAIVYCPRTHQHFGHSPYPLASIRARSIPLVLGTDSRASNPDLSIWRECCVARRVHAATWGADDAFASITTEASRILGLEKDLGSLNPGKLAFINVVKSPETASPASLLDQLLRTEAEHPMPILLSNPE
jgi:aminodeoxyfutalosine deaminase